MKKGAVIAILVLLVLGGVASAAWYLYQEKAGGNGNSEIVAYSKRYAIGDGEYEAVVVLAKTSIAPAIPCRNRFDPDDPCHGGIVYGFEGWFASNKNVGELSGTSCDISRTITGSKTDTGYTIGISKKIVDSNGSHTFESVGNLVFIEDKNGLRVDARASDSEALEVGCLPGVTWADMPAFSPRDKESITEEEYEDIQNRG